MSIFDSIKDAAQKSMEAAKEGREARVTELQRRGVLAELKSLEGTVTLYDDRLEIKNLLRSKNRVIPYAQIHAVKLDKTSALTKGTAAVMTGGMSLLATNKKRLVINVGTESVGLNFRTETAGAIRKAMDIINEQIASRGQATVIVGGGTSSVADEIGKLAELKDKGIITQPEFDAKKKQLLDT